MGQGAWPWIAELMYKVQSALGAEEKTKGASGPMVRSHAFACIWRSSTHLAFRGKHVEADGWTAVTVIVRCISCLTAPPEAVGNRTGRSV